MKNNHILISTRKGLLLVDARNDSLKIIDHFLDAIPITFSFEDPRNGFWWACADHGHWGVKLMLSKNKGKDWKEMTAPSYPEGSKINAEKEANTSYLWCMQQGGKKYPERLFIGTVPGGLFVSEDYGKNWNLVESLWNHPSREKQWFGGGFDYPGIHSILLDEANEKILVGISVAGAFESDFEMKHWIPKNKGLNADFLPNPNVEIGQDPHLIIRSKSDPKVLWQQNHCGIYRTGNNGEKWEDVSEKNGYAFFGFCIAVAEDNPDQAWVIPAVSDHKRIAIDQALVVCRTDDAGKNWIQQRRGLPQEHVFDIVYRHALANIGNRLIFGTTTGNVYYSNDRGDQWHCLCNNLALINAVSFVSSE